MALTSSSLRDYAADIASACGGDSASAPRPADLDNTRHVGACSLHAAPAILCILLVLCVLRQLLCRERLRTLYSSEDAPELEEIVSSEGAAARRVDAYGSRAGRLVVNSGGARTQSSAPPRAKRKKLATASQELEPVLWRR